MAPIEQSCKGRCLSYGKRTPNANMVTVQSARKHDVNSGEVTYRCKYADIHNGEILLH